MNLKLFIWLIVILLLDPSIVALQNRSEPIVNTHKTDEITTNCDNRYSLACIKLYVVQFLEKFPKHQEYILWPGVSFVRDLNTSDVNNDVIISEMARAFPTDPEKRLNGILSTKLTNFLQSHTLRLKLLNTQALAEACFILIGDKGKAEDKKNKFGIVLAIVMAIKGLLGTLALGALALLAGKALAAAILALVLSVVLGLKSLTGGHKPTTYEIITKPIISKTNTHSSSYDDIHSGYRPGFGRSISFDLPDYLIKN